MTATIMDTMGNEPNELEVKKFLLINEKMNFAKQKKKRCNLKTYLEVQDNA